MRNAFARAMTELAQERDDVCLLSGDIGNRMFDCYKEVAPARFFNCGIAEANMMSLAAGMGLCGMRPVVYTIAPFTTIRCLEQIKIGVAYHESPVVIVGTGSGLSYSELGPTHHSLEDMAALRVIPNIDILAPSDSRQLVQQLESAIDMGRPTYIRIGKKGEPDIYSDSELLSTGKANLIHDGSDLVIFCVGPIVSVALEVSKKLAFKGVSLSVVTMGGIRPLDDRFLQEMRAKHKLWFSLEEHSLIGGLGSTLLEWLSDNGQGNTKLIRLGTLDRFINELVLKHLCLRLG